MLSSNLKGFYPDLNNHFMCPTCLTKIPLSNKSKISEAHIIPQAAQGKIKTYLCRKCNSNFGRKQDKWFGEQIKISGKKAPKILATDIKDGYFWVDNHRVNGSWERGEDNNLHFQIHTNRNSPIVNELMFKKFESHPPQIVFSVSFPLLRNQKLVEIGYLTAAYLMWFGAIGYSWVLQNHLQPIREQILNPKKSIIDTPFILYCKEVRWRPWIGIASICSKLSLVMGLDNALVFLPPVGDTSFYSKIEGKLSNIFVSDFRVLNIPKPFYGPPVCVAFDEKVLIMPDAMTKDNLKTILLYFSPDSDEVVVAYPTTEEECKKQGNDSTIINRNLKIS